MNTQTSGNYPDVSRPDAETTELYTQSYGSSDTMASSGADQLSDKASQVADQAKAVVGDTAGKVRDQALSQIDAQKGRATDALSNISQAVRKTGDHLREQDQASIAQYADAAAEQIDRFSTYLNNRDIGQMATELQHFARRQPAVFLGGALVAGLIAARFLKSSSQQAQNYGGQGTYGYTGSGSYSGYSNYGEDYSTPASVRTNVSGYGSGRTSGTAGQLSGSDSGSGYSSYDDYSGTGDSSDGSADISSDTSSRYGSAGADSGMEES